jgi:histidyl-tRNA synthetase
MEGMKMELRAPKGTRDFLPEDKIPRDRIVAMLKESFELFGYNPIETPALEEQKTATAKFAAGEESDVMNEMFELEDKAGRKMVLRYELTFPLARLIASNPQLQKPFKRYAIGPVWRNGPLKLGRYREFWQCDVDAVGIKSMLADAEILSLAENFFDKLGFPYEIRVNNRKLLSGLLDYAGVEEEKKNAVIITIDKLSKIGIEGVTKELKEKEIKESCIKKLVEVMGQKNLEDVERFATSKIGKEGVDELKQLFDYMREFGIKNAIFDVTLARGLGYYTGPIFEVFMKDTRITSSLAAGGRWDDMIGRFAGSKEQIPAVGISFGLDVLSDAIKIVNNWKSEKSVVTAYVVPIKTEIAAIGILNFLRKNGIKADMDFNGRNISKNLEFANKLGIPYVVIAGPKEIAEGKVNLKEMESGREEKVKIEDLAKNLK